MGTLLQVWTTTAYCFGDEISMQQAHFAQGFEGAQWLSEVPGQLPSACMTWHGNVREWCEDHCAAITRSARGWFALGTRLMMRYCVSFAVAAGTAAHRAAALGIPRKNMPN